MNDAVITAWTEKKYVAIDPSTGICLREASQVEIEKYEGQDARHPAHRKMIRCGDVLVDEDTGPGRWHIPGRFQ